MSIVFEKRWVEGELESGIVEALCQELRISRPTALVLANRGVAPADAQRYLNPKLSDLSDPYLLNGTEQAAARIWEAIRAGEKIVIHGDYDVDGVTSTALLASVLRSIGGDVSCILPHRVDDGYGLSAASIDKAAGLGAQLVLTVDCGITSYDAGERASELGVDLIITDHHQPGDTLPEALVVMNPKLQPETEILQPLAGVGVTFKLCHAILKYGRQNSLGGEAFDLRDGLDLVALGTVADIVPLVNENRTLVRHGLAVLAGQRRPGVRALCEKAKINDRLKSQDISFRLAPRINAAGRLGDAIDALRLLETDSIVDAYAQAAILEDYNKRRQVFEDEVSRAAVQQARDLGCDDRLSVVVAGEGWHRGVLGIVAARLVREFSRPCLVMTVLEDGSCKGSGRSLFGVNLVEALGSCSDMLVRYGGHPMAAGLELHIDDLARFRDSFETAVERELGQVSLAPKLHCDGTVRLSDFDDRFFSELDSLEPFGHDNPAPVFRLSGISGWRVQDFGRNHCRGQLSDASGQRLPFVAFGRTRSSLPEGKWEVAVTPELSSFRGQTNPQLRIIDVRPLI